MDNTERQVLINQLQQSSDRETALINQLQQSSDRETALTNQVQKALARERFQKQKKNVRTTERHRIIEALGNMSLEGLDMFHAIFDKLLTSDDSEDSEDSD